MTGLWLRMDPAALVRALETPQDCDEVMKAAALRKRLLLGDYGTDEVDRAVAVLAAAEASPANPYGSAKHGAYTAPSAAAVAQDVERPVCRHCGSPLVACCVEAPSDLDRLGSGYVSADAPMAAGSHWCDRLGDQQHEPVTPEPTGHLPEHTGGQPGCTHEGCTEHDAAVTR